MNKPTLGALLAGCLLTLAACQSPMLVFPGKALRGEVAIADDFAFADRHALLTLEVRPERPYSVLLRTTVIDEALYIDAGARRWRRFIEANPNVRIKLGDQIYPARCDPVSDPAITRRFLPGRTIYRVTPRRP
ncbi:MAG: hypothetical protein AAF515_13180 [Pseudomonadota bacterium]